MDVHDQLNQLAATVRAAKAMPMSTSCLVNRADTLDILDRLREALPTNLGHADALLSDRAAIVAAGREQAERILDDARGEREQLIERTDVLVSARARAATVTSQARAESTRLLADADDYVDRKLAEFEVVLGQLQLQVNNGRARLVTRREADLAQSKSEAEGEARRAVAGPQVDEGSRREVFPELNAPTRRGNETVAGHSAGAADMPAGAR